MATILRLEWQEKKLKPAKLPPRIHDFYFKGRRHVVGNGLETWVREVSGWKRVCAALPDLLAFPTKTVVVGDKVIGCDEYGAIWELDGERWTRTYKPPKDLPVAGGYAGYEESTGRIVQWHVGTSGEANRDKYKTVNTWFFEDGAWRKSDHAPPAANKDWFRPALVFDRGIGRLVRFWEKDVAVLEGDAWVAYKPDGYRPQSLGRYDRDEVTGEILIVDGTEVLRFDLARCTVVAEIAPAPEENSFTGWPNFDPAGRCLVAEDADQKIAHDLDLSPAFEAARAIGPRTAPKPAKTSAKAAVPAKQPTTKPKAPPTGPLAVAKQYALDGFWMTDELAKGRVCMLFDWKDLEGDLHELVENQTGLEDIGGAAKAGVTPFAAVLKSSRTRELKGEQPPIDRFKTLIESIADEYLFFEKKTGRVLSNRSGDGQAWKPKALSGDLARWSWKRA